MRAQLIRVPLYFSGDKHAEHQASGHRVHREKRHEDQPSGHGRRRLANVRRRRRDLRPDHRRCGGVWLFCCESIDKETKNDSSTLLHPKRVKISFL